MAVTLSMIAAEVGTSVATVSLALSDHPRVNARTKKRIREASLRLGYCTEAELEVRRRDRGKRGRVLRFQFVALGRSAHHRLHREAVPFLLVDPAREGFRVELVALATTDPDIIANHVQAATDVDGFLFTGPLTATTLNLLAELDLPAVLVGPLAEGYPTSDLVCRVVSVGYDEIACGRQATNLLLAAGFHHPALVSAMGDKGLYYDRWEDGYRLALSRAGIAVDERLIDRSGGRLLKEGTWPFAGADSPPDCFIFPDPTYMADFVEVCRRLGVAAGPGNVVVSGTADSIARTRLEAFPAFISQPDLLIRTALRQLAQLVEAAAGPFSMLSLVPLTRHLDLLGQPVAVPPSPQSES